MDLAMKDDFVIRLVIHIDRYGRREEAGSGWSCTQWFHGFLFSAAESTTATMDVTTQQPLSQRDTKRGRSVMK